MTTAEKIGLNQAHDKFAEPEEPKMSKADTGGTVRDGGLVKKLLLIMSELGNIEKKGHNSAQNYDFVRDVDVTKALMPLLVKNSVYLHTSVVEHGRQMLYETQRGGTMWMDTVMIQGTWIDGDTGETLPAATFVGTGADTGDKGVYKAMTGSLKYLLLKSLMISTGDDPEGDEKVDKHVQAAGAARGSRTTVTRGSQPGVERGGQSSISTDAQRDTLKRLARELGITTGTDLMALITKVIGTYGETPPKWDTVKAFGEYLKALDATRMGQLITGVESLVAAAAPTTAAPEGTDDDIDLGYN